MPSVSSRLITIGSYILASSASNTVEFNMPAYPGLYPSFPVVFVFIPLDITLSTVKAGQTSLAWVTPVCSLSVPHRRTALASSPVYWHTDTRIRSLEPRSSLSGQDVILPAYQVH